MKINKKLKLLKVVMCLALVGGMISTQYCNSMDSLDYKKYANSNASGEPTREEVTEWITQVKNILPIVSDCIAEAEIVSNNIKDHSKKLNELYKQCTENGQNFDAKYHNTYKSIANNMKDEENKLTSIYNSNQDKIKQASELLAFSYDISHTSIEKNICRKTKRTVVKLQNALFTQLVELQRLLKIDGLIYDNSPDSDTE